MIDLPGDLKPLAVNRMQEIADLAMDIGAGTVTIELEFIFVIFTKFTRFSLVGDVLNQKLFCLPFLSVGLLSTLFATVAATALGRL